MNCYTKSKRVKKANNLSLESLEDRKLFAVDAIQFVEPIGEQVEEPVKEYSSQELTEATDSANGASVDDLLVSDANEDVEREPTESQRRVTDGILERIGRRTLGVHDDGRGWCGTMIPGNLGPDNQPPPDYRDVDILFRISPTTDDDLGPAETAVQQGERAVSSDIQGSPSAVADDGRDLGTLPISGAGYARQENFVAPEGRIVWNSVPDVDFPDFFVSQFAMPGDADLNGKFDSSDLVKIFQAGQYEDSVVGNSTWSTGDWNGDGDFDAGDLVKAFQAGNYESGDDQNDESDLAAAAWVWVYRIAAHLAEHAVVHGVLSGRDDSAACGVLEHHEYPEDSPEYRALDCSYELPDD